MCSGRHCAKTKDGESPGAIQLSHARQWRRRRRWRRWRRHSNNYKGLRAKLSRAGWRGNSRAFTNTPSLVCYGHDTVVRSLAYVNGTRTPPLSSSLPRVSASESSDTHCAIPLCYLFPSQVYAARTHTHIGCARSQFRLPQCRRFFSALSSLLSSPRIRYASSYRP